jgi:hypothetical protein
MRRSDLTTEKRENVLMGPSEVSSVFPNEPFQLGVLGALAVSNFGLGLAEKDRAGQLQQGLLLATSPGIPPGDQ